MSLPGQSVDAAAYMELFQSEMKASTELPAKGTQSAIELAASSQGVTTKVTTVERVQ